MLASYASDPLKSRGRLYKEIPTYYRNEFERDRDRIIHTNAFRRLQYKTQVFINHEEGDHYRNRLTHSLEVATVARSVANTLNLSSDLAETIALAHDLGHTPFGHVGEKALNECMKEYNGFSHNSQSLKILTLLEKRYAAYNGVNLTWEVLEGIVKHNGPILGAINEYVAEYNKQNDLELNTYASAEAQIASLADDISYISHDLEDSIIAKIIDFNNLAELQYIDNYVFKLKSKFKDISPSCLIYEIVRKLIHELITDLLLQTKENLKKEKITNINEIRNLHYQIVDFTEKTNERINETKKFLHKRVYESNKMIAISIKCTKIVQGLFKIYMDDINLLPTNWKILIDSNETYSKARVIADYIAGMTDRFAIQEYNQLCAPKFNKI
ncbi:deoxyguanosinetriphosphate triphosphohydrolase [Rickettsia typhi]|uniref:Deoxyguanosinetriphosphate triphosphohydrolase-like protein n=2 Tax=Rickettsia typhi TaxID=785 RepID=DGTL1_RICTY|nr:deoxyguanosinetriphosphate triphosphohydrolase [Rickettsia typhi]Q68XT8.1 RecName: Full=Deoxyguanosinetriphosphate triphosphohydrolase-like protein [Rickettsia typhi str. Wilmington]AAU03554.1 Deoxy-GTPase [Rickettsia typhi str. Wilmington]AFE53931.1 deoxyguanosinetriphosphate triphosphohydrolase-like protein [Rickettsia typhi str. TH1527]AFE54769.1 deoxyguanosinetriphosphate triphosphohydrolase-like protein [Rickettsia typhi str. B9991CWPP]